MAKSAAMKNNPRENTGGCICSTGNRLVFSRFLGLPGNLGKVKEKPKDFHFSSYRLTVEMGLF